MASRDKTFLVKIINNGRNPSIEEIVKSARKGERVEFYYHMSPSAAKKFGFNELGILPVFVEHCSTAAIGGVIELTGTCRRAEGEKPYIVTGVYRESVKNVEFTLCQRNVA